MGYLTLKSAYDHFSGRIRSFRSRYGENLKAHIRLPREDTVASNCSSPFEFFIKQETTTTLMTPKQDSKRQGVPVATPACVTSKALRFRRPRPSARGEPIS